MVDGYLIFFVFIKIERLKKDENQMRRCFTSALPNHKPIYLFSTLSNIPISEIPISPTPLSFPNYVCKYIFSSYLQLRTSFFSILYSFFYYYCVPHVDVLLFIFQYQFVCHRTQPILPAEWQQSVDGVD